MILLYHLIFPDNTPRETWNAGKVIRLSDFKQQISWLKKRFQIVPLGEYLRILQEDPARLRRTAAITFDDGYRATFDLVAPFLIEEETPATFFTCTSHLEDGQLLWFTYFNALCFEKAYCQINISADTYPLTSERECATAWSRLITLARASGDAIAFSSEFARVYPLPEPVRQKYLGLTKTQIRQAASSQPLEPGGHTHRHPYLDQIPYASQLDEMLTNKKKLEELSGRPLPWFAYTGGIYNKESIAAVKEAGFEAAFAVQPRRLGDEPRFEMPRLDIYSPSMLKFKIKCSGLVYLARKFLVRGV